MRIEDLQQILTTLGYNRMLATYDGPSKTWTIHIEKTQGALNSFGGCATSSSIEAAIRSALQGEGIHLPEEPRVDLSIRDKAIIRQIANDMSNAATVITLARDEMHRITGDRK